MPYCVIIARADRGRLLDVVAGAGRGLVEDELLGGAATEQYASWSSISLRVWRYLSSVRQQHGVTERPAAGQDRHLVHRVGVRQRVRDERVTALVVGDDLLFLVAHHPRLALRAGDDAVDRLLEHPAGDEQQYVA